MNKKTFIQAFGWYGMVAIVLAYALSSFSILSATDIWYQILNVTGAIGVMTVSFYENTYQPAVLNLIWAIVGIIALIKILL